MSHLATLALLVLGVLPARADVYRSLNGRFDYQGATLQGVGPFVSTSPASFEATGASTYSVTLSSGISMGGGGLRFPDGTTQYTAATGAPAGDVAVSSFTIVPTVSVTAGVFGVGLATVTITTRGFPLYINLTGSVNLDTGVNGGISFSVLLDGAPPAELAGGSLTQKIVASTFGLSASNTQGGAAFTYVLEGVSAGSHSIALTAANTGGTVSIYNNTDFLTRFGVTEYPQ